MTIVYFIRHSVPDFTVHDDMTRPLTREGLRRAEALVPVFENIQLDAIFSSPYKRTIDTILLVAKAQHLNIETLADFRERETGVWLDDFAAYAEQQWADFDYKLVSGESLNEVQTRNMAALEKILSQLGTETIAIGTHGTALSTILNYYDKSFGLTDFQRIAPQMPYLVKMDFAGLKRLACEEIDLYSGKFNCNVYK